MFTNSTECIKDKEDSIKKQFKDSSSRFVKLTVGQYYFKIIFMVKT